MNNKQDAPKIKANGKPTDEILEQVETKSDTAKTDEITTDDDLENVVAQDTKQNYTQENPKELKNQLNLAEKKAAENWDKIVRAQAEIENIKKRAQRDLENAHKYGLEQFAKELLVVIDSLELGIHASNSDNPEVIALKQGSELTIKQFESVFAKFNIEALNPVGLTFNPELHQAMTMQPSADSKPNTVIDVLQKGYILNGRLIRPARVVVSQAVKPKEK